MALNIKSDEAHHLARQLAEARGTSLKDAVTEALRETLDADRQRSEPDVLIRDIAEIQGFVADLPDRDTRSPDEVLGYDEAGLPG